MRVISVLSTEFVRTSVSATESGATINPSADTVQMAFVPAGSTPVSGDWKNASWETDATTDPDTYYARALVGPGAGAVIALTAGVLYDVYVKIVDSPESPVINTGPLGVL